MDLHVTSFEFELGADRVFAYVSLTVCGKNSGATSLTSRFGASASDQYHRQHNFL